jgi:hypothetical protein
MTHKVKNLKDNSFSLSDARQARMVLDKYTDEETMKANIAAAAICKWVCYKMNLICYNIYIININI